MTAVLDRPSTIADAPTRRPHWLRERGMGASVLIAALSAGLGVLLIGATLYLGAMFRADPYIGDSETLAIVVGILSVLLVSVSVYVAAIVTANTFSTIIAGRTRQIALMRLIGASARSQRARVASQGLVVGLIGAMLGLVVGAAALFGLSRLVTVFGLPDVGGVLHPAIAVPAVFVALTTWAAAWVGSRRVLTVTPLQALGGSVERSADEATRPSRTVLALVMLLLGALLLVGGIVVGTVTPLGVIVAFFGGLFSFTGLALGSTFIMPPLLRLSARLFGRSATSRLAAENALRHPERSSRMAIGVVMGVTLVTMFAVASESAKGVITASAGGEPDQQFAGIMDSFASVMIAVVSVSAIIAAVGLVNLLTIGVVQRRRELGLLRALGFSNAQVRRLILIEAGHVVVTSVVTGLVLGVVYGWAGAQSALGAVRVPPAWSSPTVVLPAVPWALVVGIVVVTAVLTLVAAVTPTRMATRVAPVEALAAD